MELSIFVIFTITMIVDILLIGGLIFTIYKPKYRIWPPPDKYSWQFWVTWALAIISFSGTLLLTIVDWDNFIFKYRSRIPIGVLIIVLGLFLAVWGVKTLSLHSTLGLKGTLVTDGPYKYLRNPQYLADILLFTGLLIIANSLLVLIIGLLGILWNILTPFAEESWLREQFGDEYNEYCKKVKRFI
ncbi:MAG: methyltransferase family protein [Candidatus Odinarchaeota archaeon]